MKKIGAEAFAEKCEHLGVSNYGMQQKFGISHADLRRLTRIGFLQVTGKERFGKPVHITTLICTAYSNIFS